jgi:hypothetical protein
MRRLKMFGISLHRVEKGWKGVLMTKEKVKDQGSRM